jgi:hypothetical protein
MKINYVRYQTFALARPANEVTYVSDRAARAVERGWVTRNKLAQMSESPWEAAMDRFVTRQDIDRYRKLADETTSAAERRQILKLLAEEKARFRQEFAPRVAIAVSARIARQADVTRSGCVAPPEAAIESCRPALA